MCLPAAGRMDREVAQNVLQNFLGILSAASTEDCFKTFLPEGSRAEVFRFCEPVSVSNQNIAGFELKCPGFIMGLLKRTHRHTSGVQRKNLAPATTLTNYDGWVVPGVHVSKETRRRLIFRVEER